MSLHFEQLDEYRWEIPATGKMRVPGRIYASEAMMAQIRQDKSPQQVANVAQLPGIVERSIAMPDMHWGYGFPIGGVAAFEEATGVISPGGVGYDINCGVRLLRSDLRREELVEDLEALSVALHQAVPSGIGSESQRHLSRKELDQVLRQGAGWAVKQGLGWQSDLELIEEGGCMRGAEPAALSARAKERGLPQLGSLGSGNHFCELGYVAEIYDEVAAEAFGLEREAVTVMIHTGSRGLGYQVCDDSLRMMLTAAQDHGIELPDRQLCAAPLTSQEADHYFGAMGAAINYAFANRQVLTHTVREALGRFLRAAPERLGLRVVYDVCHNIAKWEEHTIRGRKQQVCVHRKGATRAFGPGHEDLPAAYRSVGQPVLIPGDMGRYSFVLAGTERAMGETFGSSCHGAGRRMSRRQAKKESRGRPIFEELQQKGIYVRSDSYRTVLEEVPEAYKDVAEVVEVVHGAGIAKKVCKLIPLAVIKG